MSANATIGIGCDIDVVLSDLRQTYDGAVVTDGTVTATLKDSTDGTSVPNCIDKAMGADADRPGTYKGTFNGQYLTGLTAGRDYWVEVTVKRSDVQVAFRWRTVTAQHLDGT